jgi:hypothetical protein
LFALWALVTTLKKKKKESIFHYHQSLMTD